MGVSTAVWCDFQSLDSHLQNTLCMPGTKNSIIKRQMGPCMVMDALNHSIQEGEADRFVSLRPASFTYGVPVQQGCFSQPKKKKKKRQMGGSKMAQWVEELALGPRWWKQRTESYNYPLTPTPTLGLWHARALLLSLNTYKELRKCNRKADRCLSSSPFYWRDQQDPRVERGLWEPEATASRQPGAVTWHCQAPSYAFCAVPS